MTKVDADTLAAPIEPDTSALDNAFSKPFPQAREIDISFFSHKTRRSTALIGNDLEENHVKARRHWLDFDFKEVIYVSSIRVFAAGYEDYHEMELSYTSYLGDDENKITSKFSGDHFLFQPRDFMKGFGLRPSDPMFRTAQITKVLVSGVEKHSVTEVARFVENIEREKTRIEDSLSAYFSRAEKSYREIEENRETIEQLSDTISEKTAEVEQLKTTLQELSHSQQKAQEDIQVASTVYKEQVSRSEALQQSIDKLVDDRKELTAKVSQYQSQLQELKANINLFPTEIAGYVQQGTSNIRLYAALCAIPMMVIVYVTLRLFSNSERLLDEVRKLGDINIFEFLLSRLPYVTVSAAILGICYTMLKALISEIITINRRRQELFKISIIATDVSYASQDGMDLSDEQRYELRTQTKMELLKEHLKQNVGEDYTYSPRKVFMERLKRLPPKEEGAAEVAAE